MRKYLTQLIFFSALLLLPGAALAQSYEYYSLNDGDWTDEEMWDIDETDFYPGNAAESVFIANSLTLSEDGLELGDLAIDSDADLDLSGNTLTVDDLVVYGSIYGNDGTIIVNGNLTINGYVEDVTFEDVSGNVIIASGASVKYTEFSEVGGDFSISAKINLNSVACVVRGNLNISAAVTNGNFTVAKSTTITSSGSLTGALTAKADVVVNNSVKNLKLTLNSAKSISISGSGSLTLKSLTLKGCSKGVSTDVDMSISGDINLDKYVITATEGHSITSSSSSAAISYNDGGYIAGDFYRKVTKGSTVEFPVGSNGVTGYALFTNGSASTVTFAVAYVNEAPSGSTEALFGDDEYWVVTPSADLNLSSVSLRPGSMNFDLTAANTSGCYSAIYVSNGSAWNYLSDCVYNSSTDQAAASGISYDIAANSSARFAFGLKTSLFDSSKSFASYDYSEDSDSYAWLGYDTDWSNTSNWKGGKKPGSKVDVVLRKYVSNGQTLTINYTDGSSEVAETSCSDATEVANFPVITNSQTASIASLTIEEGASITLDGGLLKVAGALTVKDNNEPGAVIVNNYSVDDNAVGDVTYCGGSNLYYGSTNYSLFTINRTFATGFTFYTGSATKEGTVESGYYYEDPVGFGFCGLNNGGDVDDVLESFDATNVKYVPTSSLTAPAGNALWLGWPNDEYTRTLTQIGTPFTSELTVSLVNKDDAKNLLCNPYLFPLDISSALSLGSSVSSTVVFRKHSSDAEYYYSTYNISVGTGVSQAVDIDGATSESSSVIAPQQGFFLVTNVADEDNYVKFSPSYKSVKGTSYSLKSANVSSDILKLQISSNDSYSDETAIAFRVGGDVNSVLDDSKKSADFGWNLNGDFNLICTVKDDGSKNAIALYPIVSEILNKEIKLTVVTKESKATISANGISLFDNSVDVYLNDAKNGQSVNLREGNYDFVATPNTEISDRFSITLKSVSSPLTALDDVAQSLAIKIVKAANSSVRVVIPQSEVSATVVNVYDLSGRLILSRGLDAAESLVSVPSTGMFLVEVITSTSKKSVKVNL